MKTYPPSPRISPNTRRLLAYIGLALMFETAVAQAAPLRIMPLGDSITYGFNGINYPNGSIPGGYRKQLGIRLAAAGMSYDFVGNSTLNAAAGTTTTPPATGPQLLTNGSFESDFTGWSRSGNQMIQSSGAYAATDGTRLVAFNAGNSAPNGVISQTFATTAGVAYSLTFDAGVLAYTTSEQRLQVSVEGSGSRLSQVVSISGPGNGGTRWVRQNFSFTANSTTTTLTFRDQSASTNSLDLLLDNVSVTGGGSGGTAVTNTPPVAVADSYSTDKNTSLVIAAKGVLSNDTDAQANPLTAVLSSAPANGSIVLNANGGFTYTPAANFTGADSFSYHANDSLLNSNVVSVGITVSAPASVGALVNGSFESGFTGWTISGNQSIASAAPYAATAGTKLVSFNAANLAPNAVLSQSFATTAGQSYTLAFDAGVLSYNTSSQTMQVTVTGTAGLLTRSITINGLGGGTNRWLPQTFSFTADSASATLTFRDQSASTNSLDLLLDNVRVTGPQLLLASPATPASLVVETAIAASSAVAQPLPFTTATPTLTGEPGNLAIRMAAVAPGSYVLERSSDLITWELAEKRIMHDGGPLEFLETSNIQTAMFYRIGLETETAAD